MNIFVLDRSPFKSATMLSNEDISKMIINAAKLMSTAHRFLDGKCVLTEITRKSHTKSLKSHWRLDDERERILYKATQIHHPCAKWVRESSANYKWLFEYFVALNVEYIGRFGKVHKTYRTLWEQLKCLPNNLKHGELTQFVQYFDDKYKDEDPIQGYRNYYSAEKLFTTKDELRFFISK